MGTINEQTMIEALVGDINRFRRRKARQFKKWRDRRLPDLKTISCTLCTTSQHNVLYSWQFSHLVQFKAVWGIHLSNARQYFGDRLVYVTVKFGLEGNWLMVVDVNLHGSAIRLAPRLDLRDPTADPTRYMVKHILAHCLGIQRLIDSDWSAQLDRNQANPTPGKLT